MYGLDVKTFELLKESGQLMEQWAREDCAFKSVGGMEEWAKDNELHGEASAFSCDWYHGTWQYMRLLNMVAVPNWYRFYVDAINAVLQENPTAKVLISACADYGMLAKLHESMQEVNANPEIIIYDICMTPLKSCEWYAAKFGLKIKCVCENIITGSMPEAPFDLIITDEFLSVLKSDYKPQICKKWKEILKPEGTIVTTGMIGKPTVEENRKFYAEKAKMVFDMYSEMLFPQHTNGKSEQLLNMFGKFAAYHTRHMLTDENELRDLFKDFSRLSLEVTKTPGECVNPTDSFQIVAKL